MSEDPNKDPVLICMSRRLSNHMLTGIPHFSGECGENAVASSKTYVCFPKKGDPNIDPNIL